jgi:hypothetical protein
MGRACSTNGKARRKEITKIPINKDNIKMDVREIGLGIMDCIDLIRDRDRGWLL